MLMPNNQATFMARIAQMPRAAREFSNAEVLDKLSLCQEAIQQLGREGHMVVGAKLAAGRVTITIAACARLANLAAQGKAVYYMHGVDQDGLRFRKGVLLGYRNVNVVWVERGN